MNEAKLTRRQILGALAVIPIAGSLEPLQAAPATELPKVTQMRLFGNLYEWRTVREVTRHDAHTAMYRYIETDLFKDGVFLSKETILDNGMGTIVCRSYDMDGKPLLKTVLENGKTTHHRDYRLENLTEKELQNGEIGRTQGYQYAGNGIYDDPHENGPRL